MMFVDTEERGEIAMSRIIRAVPAPKGMIILYFEENGETKTAQAFASAWEDAQRKAVQQMIPAAPGTCVLTSGLDEEGFYTFRSDVIAWAASADGAIHPVTAEGVNDDSSMSLPILHPSGIVDHPFNRRYDSFAEWASETEKAKRAEGAPTSEPKQGGGV